MNTALPADAIALMRRGLIRDASSRRLRTFAPSSGFKQDAHADPRAADYYIGPDDRSHDLLLFGNARGRNWFAAISLLALVKAVHSLPDAKLANAEAEPLRGAEGE